jgi:hypothetical protein
MAPLPACLCAVLFAAGPVSADDAPKPNTLTPKEVAEGWLLLFDGETTFGWKTDGDVKAKDGELIVTGPKDKVVASFQHLPYQFELLFDAKGDEVSVRVNTPLGSTAAPEWTTFRLRFSGLPSGHEELWSVLTNGTEKLTHRGAIGTFGPSPASGVNVFGTVKPTRLRNIKLRPLNTTPLFNGKDLTGWKVFPGEKYKSKFEVTKDGELHVTNGPGDLQTEKQFDNFVLQLECKTNGKALNSGVFFRCLPDQYQNGYEAQIQNAFKNNDRTQPADFGTGAIYRRVPARKVVSNDNEWFTMTVVADGTHIATWVNGVQVVDWTDTRPPHDNPRQGSKTGKGHLSIQGHDPTTDLLFRNIRIAELPAKK